MGAENGARLWSRLYRCACVFSRLPLSQQREHRERHGDDRPLSHIGNYDTSQPRGCFDRQYSSNRRIASGRLGRSLCWRRQLSNRVIKAAGMRTPTVGLVPVAGRPRFFAIFFS